MISGTVFEVVLFDEPLIGFEDIAEGYYFHCKLNEEEVFKVLWAFWWKGWAIAHINKDKEIITILVDNDEKLLALAEYFDFVYTINDPLTLYMRLREMMQEYLGYPITHEFLIRIKNKIADLFHIHSDAILVDTDVQYHTFHIPYKHDEITISIART